jgi:hypothetical protein
MTAKVPITDPLQAEADAPTTLDLSGLTTLEQLQHLDVRCSFDSPSVMLTSFGDTLDRLTRLRSLSLNVVLHEQALAQVRVNYQCMCTVGYLRKCSNMRVSVSAGAARHQSSAACSVLLAAPLLQGVTRCAVSPCWQYAVCSSIVFKLPGWLNCRQGVSQAADVSKVSVASAGNFHQVIGTMRATITAAPVAMAPACCAVDAGAVLLSADSTAPLLQGLR